MKVARTDVSLTARSLAIGGLAIGVLASGPLATTSTAQSAPPRAAASPAVPTSQLPAGLSFVRSIEGIHEYRLANGLQILLLPDPSQPKVTVNIVYRVGSRHEGLGEAGMAHLLEHLLFKGTPRHPDIPLELRKHGASFNGTTYYDRTNYYETLPSGIVNLAWALDLEADRMVNSFVSRKDLDSEMTVVRNEFEIRDSQPGTHLYQAIDAAMFRWHGYGKPTIGNRSDIENVGIDRLQSFYRRYYRPDNAVLVVGGEIEPSATLALIAKSFGPIPKPEQPIPLQYTVEPAQDGERAVTVRRVGDSQIVALAYRVMSAQHADAAKLMVLSRILGQAPNGRLHRRLVESGKATSASASVFAGYDPGRMVAVASLPKQGSVDDVRDELVRVVEGLASEPITQAEVDRAKASFALAFETRRANTQAFATDLTTPIADGDWRLAFWQRDEIAKLTAADVQRAALHYLKRDNRTLGQFIPTDAPDRAEIPPRPDPEALLKDYRGGAQASQGEAFEPSQANIDARTTTVTLPSGLKLALLPKQTQGDRVRGQLSLNFGDPDTLKGWGVAPSMLGALLTKGTRRMSRGALSDELTRLKAELSISGDANSATARFAVPSNNLDELMRLIVECLREPAFPADEFEQSKRAGLHGIENALKTPQSLVSNRISTLFNAYPKDHPYYAGTFAEQREQLERVTLDDVKRFHATVYNAGHGQVSLIGPFDPDKVQRLTSELLGSWKAPKPYVRIPAASASVAPQSEVIEVADQANALFIARHSLKMRDTDPDYPALVVANSILGGSAMSSRLGTRLRQQEGLSYRTGSSLNVGALDDTASFSISASSAPQSAGKLEAAVRDELARALKDGFTAEEVNTARDGMLSARRSNRSNDGVLVGALDSNLFLGRTMKWSTEFEDKLRALTAEQVGAAFRRHIDPALLVTIKAGSFATVKPTP